MGAAVHGKRHERIPEDVGDHVPTGPVELAPPY